MARYNDITIKPNTNPAQTTEQSTRLYRGISTTDNTRNTSRYDIDLIRQDVINSMNIRQGEKIYQPNVGTIVWDHLYEPLTHGLKQRLVQDVTRVIQQDPRVELEDVAIDSKEYGIMIIVTLKYISYNISETLQLNFDQDNALL